MPKKLDPSFVKTTIEATGWVLHEPYVGSKIKMKATCPNGHITSINWSTWNSGSGCGTCGQLATANSRRLDPDFVRLAITSEDYILHDTYKNSGTRMSATCNNGHETSILWDSWKVGNRCRECAYISNGNLFRNDDSVIRNALESEGWQMVGEYKNSSTPIQVICDKGHNTTTLWDNWKSGKRCKVCQAKLRGHKRRLDQNKVKASFEGEGWKLNSPYETSDKKLEVTCDKGHNILLRWADWQKGIRCAVCHGRYISTEDVSKAFENVDYTLLSEYKRSDLPLNFICDKGHHHSITWDCFKQGQRCAVCAGKMRKTQNEVESAFSEIGYTLLSQYINDKTHLEFICSNGHRHSIPWSNFNQGQRCAYCAERGFDMNKPGILYYLRFDIDSVPYYKVGITNRTVKERYRMETNPYVILKETRYLKGFLAKEEESLLLKTYSEWRYKGPKLLRNGNTELFTKDILGLDQQCQTKLLSLSI